MSEESPYLVELKDGIKTVTFNQPKRRNPISSTSAEELIIEVNKCMEDGTRVLIFTGAGGAFSAGADLRPQAREGEQIDPGTMINRTYHTLIRAVAGLERPVIAAVDGVAAGFGLSLALSSDIVLASDRSTFSLVFMNIALMPDGGLTWVLPRLIGMHRALELAYTAQVFKAEDALRWGLINHVYPAEKWWEETMQLARRLADGPVRVMGLTKRLYQEHQLTNLDAVLTTEAMEQGNNMMQADFAEGVTAFFEKRKPKFS